MKSYIGLFLIFLFCCIGYLFSFKNKERESIIKDDYSKYRSKIRKEILDSISERAYLINKKNYKELKMIGFKTNENKR